jgi:prepilin peptidase CpaA
MMSAIWMAFTILLLASVVSDARSYRIPNWAPLALSALFLIAVALSGRPILSYWPHLATGAGVLAAGFVLYRFTGLGAGDAKLAGAVALWAGLPGLYPLTFLLTLMMTILALALVIVRRVPAGSALRPKVFQKGAPVPLGIAIGFAAIAASFRFEPSLWAF